MKQAVLVTGGAGFVGSHVCQYLASLGILPVTLDNLSMGHRDAAQWGPLIVGDIADRDLIGAVLRDYGIKSVLHFAGWIAVGESVRDPSRYYANNVAATLRLLDALIEHGVTDVIFSSSAAVYGNPTATPIPEAHATSPTSPYGRTKLMIEQVLCDYARAYSLRSASLRYFNAAGADPAGKLGERHSPETHLIPLVLETALGRRPEIEIFGDRYDTPDGTCIRDYVHVVDLAAAHHLALQWLSGQAPGTAAQFNLGNGNGCSVREVILAAQRVTGRAIKFRISAPRPGDPAILVACADHAQRTLKWAPRFAALETQIAHCWNYLCLSGAAELRATAVAE